MTTTLLIITASMGVFVSTLAAYLMKRSRDEMSRSYRCLMGEYIRDENRLLSRIRDLEEQLRNKKGRHVA